MDTSSFKFIERKKEKKKSAKIGMKLKLYLSNITNLARKH